MSTVRLNNVWNEMNQEIGFYTSENFHKVPDAPGVYAWFYPLRITTHDLNQFLEEVDVILNYDSSCEGPPTSEFKVKANWEITNYKTEKYSKEARIESYQAIWDEIGQTEDSFDELRKTIMISSIFLPPLYVGKTISLFTRCQQHIHGTGKDNSFHNRYENYASKVGSINYRVSDLLFVCVKVKNEICRNARAEELIEAMLKFFAKPMYSKI